MKENIIKEKSMIFSQRIVRLYKYLKEEKSEEILSKQLLRSGTSIGANIHEAVYAQSRRDFVSKMSIALKEAGESEYWLELLSRTEYLSESEYLSMREDCKEIIRILVAIVKNAKE